MSDIDIGIDLGTTFSCIAHYNRHLKLPEVIKNKLGKPTTPSMVAFTNKGVLAGNEALNRLPLDPVNTVFDSKRMIGKEYKDKHVKEDKKHWPFKIVKGDDGFIKIAINQDGEEELYPPEFISSEILRYLVDSAKKNLGKEVKDVVITIPAHFDNSQRVATQKAGKIAGLNVLQTLNEPTAAAIAYEYQKDFREKRNILVFDLGGGTFDVSIMSVEIGKDGKPQYEALAADGDPHLGGQDFDNALVEYFAARFEKKEGIDIFEDNEKCKRSLIRLKLECEKAKIQLSSLKKVNIEIPNFYDDITLKDKIRRDLFDFLSEDLYEKITDPIESVLEMAGLEEKDINDLIIVGGSSRIPKVAEKLKEQFGKDPIAGADPDEAIALGAAIQCYNLHKSKPKTEPKPEPKHKTEPKHKSLIDKEYEEEEEEEDDMYGIDVINRTSLTYGIRIKDGKMLPLIKRNTDYKDAKRTIPVTTTRDGQEKAHIVVYEGERSFVKDNKKLGKFVVDDLPKDKPAGTVQINFTIEVDNSGTLICNASVVDSDKVYPPKPIKSDQGNLDEAEIDKLIKQGEKFKKQDEMRSKFVDFINDFETLVENLRKKARRKKDHDALTELSAVMDNINDKNNPTTKELEGVFKELQKENDKIQKKYSYLLK